MKTTYFLMLWVCLCICTANGQGCSDAGFCTMGAMKPAQPYRNRLNVRLRSVEFQQYAAHTPFKDWVIAYTIDANVGVGNKTMLQVKLPYGFTFGQLDNTHGVGDLSLSATRNVFFQENLQINLTIGTKIPTGKANKKTADGLPLPMYYQQTLGTTDFIAGLSVSNRNWLLAAGYQNAFGTIENSFLWGPWNNATKNGLRSKADSIMANKYPRSNQLKRGKDIMFRVERNFRFSKVSFNLGLLPIIRLTSDEITLQGKRVKQPESKGLTLNGLIGGIYHFSARTSLSMINGFALIQRKSNPDGLSRDYVSTIGLTYKF